jgi:hypothetical protein
MLLGFWVYKLFWVDVLAMKFALGFCFWYHFGRLLVLIYACILVGL